MSYIRILLLLTFTVSFSASAQTAGYTLTQLSYGFIIGLSLPVLALSIARSVEKPTIFVFPSLLFIALLFFIGCVGQNIHLSSLKDNHIWLCSAANAYLGLLLLVPNKADWFEELTMPKLRWLTLLLLAFFVLFELSLFVFPELDHKVTWLVWFLIAGILAYWRGYLVIREQQSSFFWLLVAFLVTLISGATFWLWLNELVDEQHIYQVIGLGYLIVLLHFSWALVKYQPSSGKHSSHTLDHEDWQLYARDAVTNFPLQGQAIKKLEYSLLSGDYNRVAAIAFKPVNFAQANKILGYENSDALLLQLAFSMQKQSLTIDGLINLSFANIPFYVARLHSLHFLIVLDLTNNKHEDRQVVEHVCQQLIGALPQAMTFKSYTMNFELAFGISMLSKGDSSVKQAIALAEDALLKAEQLHQPIYFFDQSLSQISQAQLVRMERLKSSIEVDDFTYFIQPQINLKTKDVIGYEVLIRWSYDKDLVLEQNEVQSLAAQSGDAFTVFQLLFKRALTWLAELDDKGLAKPVSINLESLELLDEVTVEYIEVELKAAQLSPRNLMISISEHLLLSAGDRVKLAFDQLRQVGVRISINEFSGSYEALRYVRRLAVDQVRISCATLTFKDDREPEKAIVQALIHLANVINLPLVGTHVNSAAVELLFRELDGENAQGEIIAPAVLSTEAPQWLAKWIAYQEQQAD
ncbi:EAL domain-containing protein [Thalassotalea sp. LPB0316]|uniref:EAL domain-containing protein n=1 Tax=Thalassotalea sp. LPB0316 TaxID=2769490 RepID=UPI0018668FBA|nr:EAL domain-containing protein [Thalassotalea sp. LPB0316]QOL26000.1 EAL domain-containing protein [Thalassotalea sp. LPB0316]